MLTYSAILSQYIISQQDKHTTTLSRLVDSYNAVDAKVLAKDLKSAFAYQALNLSEYNGPSLYKYEDQNTDESLGYLVLNSFGMMPQPKKVVSQTHNLGLQFQLRFTDELALFDTFFYSSLLVLFVVLSLLIISLRQLIQRVVRRSIANISGVINEFTESDDSIAWDDLPDDFLPLAESLETLHINYETKIKEWRESAENFRTEATRDELTGLKNRISFVEYFEDKLNNLENLDFGVLAVTRASELNHINQNRGYQAGDAYVAELAQIITRVANTYDAAEIYRLNGSDFAVVLPNVTAKESENYATNLQGRLGELQKSLELEAVAYSGLVSYESGRPLGELLALSDTGISISQTKYPNAWHMQTDTSVLENVSAKYGNQNWREVIDDVVKNARAILYYQPIQPTNKNSKVYNEVLARFANADGQVLPTASFVAMAEKMDKIIFVDKMIVEQTMKQILERGLQTQYFGLNVTAKSAHDEQFAIWLERRLLRDPAVASKLVFEVTEFGMQQNMAASKRFLDMVHRTGARVTVERFGMGMTSFKFFRELKPDFIKMDGSYSRGIDEDKSNQYFLRVIVDLAHRLGVNVLCESVETQEEKHCLEQVFVDGTQGYFIGKPVEF
ncbi:EAL domain-containing protein [Algibacillus agarilyticus]|uniref:EAL domain-containing protein n=1 Tax=Algibacillus agarilyticus TaxID=2234133 RepID=UPI001E372FE1|nr:EAL domain-containing protein [Algibacillus agarilyticus]